MVAALLGILESLSLSERPCDQTVLWAYAHGKLSGLPRWVGKIQTECGHRSLAWGPEKAGGTLRMHASSLCS